MSSQRMTRMFGFSAALVAPVVPRRASSAIAAAIRGVITVGSDHARVLARSPRRRLNGIADQPAASHSLQLSRWRVSDEDSSASKAQLLLDRSHSQELAAQTLGIKLVAAFRNRCRM